MVLGCFGGVFMMVSGCFGDVFMMVSGCFGGVFMMVSGCFGGVFMMVSGCFGNSRPPHRLLLFVLIPQTERGTEFRRSHHLVGKTTLCDMAVDPTCKYAAVGCQDRCIR